MGLETEVNAIRDLNPDWPTGSEFKAFGDDHMRKMKGAMRKSFAGFDGAILVTGDHGGTANAITLTSDTPVPAYSEKMLVLLAPSVGNTGACTLDISGLGPKGLKAVNGAALAPSDLSPGMFYLAVYTGIEFRLCSITKTYADQLAFAAVLPSAPSDGLPYKLSANSAVFTWELDTLPFLDHTALAQAQAIALSF